MASGKSIQLGYITGPWPQTFHDSARHGTYVNPEKDRRLAGKKRRLDKRRPV